MLGTLAFAFTIGAWFSEWLWPTAPYSYRFTFSALCTALALAAFVIGAFVDALKRKARDYEAFVAPIYAYHPVVGDGIDVHSIEPNARALTVYFNVESRPGQAILITLDKGISTATATLSEESDKGIVERDLEANLVTPTFLKIDTTGVAGGVQGTLGGGDDIHIMAIEWCAREIGRAPEVRYSARCDSCGTTDTVRAGKTGVIVATERPCSGCGKPIKFTKTG